MYLASVLVRPVALAARVLQRDIHAFQPGQDPGMPEPTLGPDLVDWRMLEELVIKRDKDV